MALRLEILELSGKVSRSAEFGRNRAYGVGTAGVPKRVGQGIFRDLGGTDPKTTGRLGGPGVLPKVQPAHPDIWNVSRHGLGAAGPVL